MAAEHDARMDMDGEEQDERETTTNPLLLPVVLDILCNVCELSELKRFRLVCKPWYNQSLRRWRNSMVLCVSEDFRHPRLETDTSLGLCNTKALTDRLPEIKNKPYRNYSLHLHTSKQSIFVEPFEVSRRSREDYEAFWNKIGPMMVSLRLDIEEGLFDWKSSSWFIEKTPNLESLELENYLDSFITAAEDKVHTKLTKIRLMEHSDCWSAILQTFPNLVDITLMLAYDAQDIRTISDAMRFDGEPNRKIRLNTNWKIKGGPEILDLLLDLRQTPNLKFPEFGIELVGDHLHATAVMQGLHSTMAQTLKRLMVDDMVYFNFIPVNRLLQDTWPQLQRLSVECRVVRNLNFLKDAPNLYSLVLRRVEHDQLSATLSDDTNKGALDKLKILEIDMQTVENLRVSDIRLFAHLAPNLNDLAAQLDNESFRAVCTWYKDIRHLTVLSTNCGLSTLDDAGITGITGVIDGINVPFPNIMNIKYLYSFRAYATKFSDLSIYEGFLKMQHLCSMKMCFASMTSDAAFGAICERFPEVKRLMARIPGPNI